MEPFEQTPETIRNAEIETTIQLLLKLLNEHKPNDRSELDRLWAILRTDVQKAYAFWLYMEMQ
jgi:hypothetical protein